MKRISLILLMLLASTTIISCGIAQAGPHNGKNTQELSTFPDTPNLPRFNGINVLFLRGYKTTTLKNSNTGLNCTFATKESKQAVLSWYKNVMNQNGWVVDDSTINSGSITGIQLQQGHSCSVQVNDSTEPGYSALVNVAYSSFKPYSNGAADEAQKEAQRQADKEQPQLQPTDQAAQPQQSQPSQVQHTPDQEHLPDQHSR